MFDSSPHITENNVNENQRAGVIVSGSSFPKIEKNSIFGNSSSGIIIRDNSSALILNNKVWKFNNLCFMYRYSVITIKYLLGK